MKCPECLGEMLKVTYEAHVKSERMTEEELTRLLGMLMHPEMHLCRNCGILLNVVRVKPSR